MRSGPQPECVTKTALNERGWTAGLITRLLGEPDHIATNPHRRRGPPVRLYLRARVLLAEDTQDFRDAQMALTGRRAKATATTLARHAEQVRWASAVEIRRTRDFRKPLSTHRGAALRDRTARDHEGGSLSDAGAAAPEQHVAQWTLNHIRHNCTNYDELVAKVPLTRNREAYGEIRRRVDELICDAYPELRVACEAE